MGWSVSMLNCKPSGEGGSSGAGLSPSFMENTLTCMIIVFVNYIPCNSSNGSNSGAWK